MGETKWSWKSVHNTREMPPSTLSHQPQPGYCRLQQESVLTKGRCVPNSRVQAMHRPPTPKLRVSLKLKVLKADLVGGFVWFIILHISERGSEEGQQE